MAYEDDGTPAAASTQTPDLAAASGQPAGGGSSIGLMDALSQGQGGGIPNEAILSLLQGPSVGQRMAQAGAGGVAFMRGQPNPVNAIIEQQQKQQLGIMQVLQRMQEQESLKAYRMDQLRGADAARKETRELHKQNMLEKYTSDLIASPDPEANLLGWTTRGTQMASAGFPIPPAVLQGLARKDLPKETMAQAVRLYGSMPFPEIAAMYKGIKPEHEQFIAAAKNSDDYRKGLGLESRLEEGYKADEMDIKRAAAQLAVLKFDRDQERLDLDLRRQDESERRTAVSEQRAITADRRAETSLGLAIRGADRGDRALGIQEQRLEIQRRELDRKFESKDEKRQTSLNVMSSWLDEVDAIAEKLDKKSMLPKTSKGIVGGLLSGDTSAMRSGFNRITNPYDNDWIELTKVLQGGAVGFERTVHNDIGPRAIAAFKGILAFMENPAQLSAIKQSTNYMREAIKTAGRTGPPTANQEIVYKSGGKILIEKWSPGDRLPPDAQVITIDGKPPQ